MKEYGSDRARHRTNAIPVDDPVARAIGVMALAGIGLIHFVDLFGKWGETRYVAWLYIGLIAGLVLASWLLLAGHHVAGWRAAGSLAAATLVGFIVSRAWGLPSAGGDIGNWTEPLGTASLFVEAVAVILSVVVLYEHRASRHPGSADLPLVTPFHSSLATPAAPADAGNGARRPW